MAHKKKVMITKIINPQTDLAAASKSTRLCNKSKLRGLDGCKCTLIWLPFRIPMTCRAVLLSARG